MEVSRSAEASAPRATAFFRAVTRFPRAITIVSLIVLVLTASQILSIVRDTTVDAFMPTGHPALVYRDKVEEIFGLRDPIVIAVLRDEPGGVFTPVSLALVERLTEAVKGIENIDPERVRSLATEKNIVGTEDGLVVTPFLDPMPETPMDAERVRLAVQAIPLYMGTLVAKDGSGTLIMAEVVDPLTAGQTYQHIETLIADAQTEDHRVLIAGEGAVGGYLSIYLNEDARKLQPIAFLIILVVMAIAFRSRRAFFIPIAIIMATVGGSMGLMGAAGVPYYIITSALPVILIGIAVADSIHLLSRYYEELAIDPEAEQRTIVVRAMAVMWRPVVLTSLTTIAGFAGISATSGMPPMFWFGAFAIIGVLFALVYSMIFLPAAMCLFEARPSPAFRPNAQGESYDTFARLLGQIGLFSINRAQTIVVLCAVLVGLGIAGLVQLKTDRARIENFSDSAPIYQAHSEINKRFSGTSYLDIVVETPEVEGLFDPDRLARIEALQTYLEGMSRVQDSVSIVDYLKQMHKAMNGNDPAFYRLPDDPDLIAQYFLLYSAMGGPTDFQEEIDYDYRRALVRFMINDSRYSTDIEIVQAAEDYIKETFSTEDLTANLSGRLNVDYHWMMPLARNHFLSICVSLLLVFAMSALLFRSFVGGVLTVAPVLVAVLSVYAVMGFTNIWLEPATSMFAAIAIGLGVDFPIHIIDRLRYLIREQSLNLRDACRALYPSAGRALFFNFLALFLGFGALVMSEMPPLYRLGTLIAAAMAANFISAVIFLPALVTILRPKFCGLEGFSIKIFRRGGGGAAAMIAVAVLGSVLALCDARADEPLDGPAIARNISDRPDGVTVRYDLTMTLTNRSGSVRTRETVILRKEDDEARRIAVFFLKPTNVRGTAFLTYDYKDSARTDNRWLYLPAMRRVRRISASDRGDYFIGTDFTYQDIQDSTKFSLDDYHFTLAGEDMVDGATLYRLDLQPQSPKIAKELGYSHVVTWVDPENWMPRKADFWDTNDNFLKTITLSDVRQIQGIWTVMRITAENHKTGHKTELLYNEVNYEADIPDDRLTQGGLRRGL